ncbi:MAG TPA: hypothetical protein DEG71_04995 [Clostridiales bacterium]|nr:hypothetical protein [Clostridiales bacterium]
MKGMFHREAILIKYGDRIEVIKAKISTSGNRILAPVGAKGTAYGDEYEYSGSDMLIVLDGHAKGCWMYPNMLKKISE